MVQGDKRKRRSVKEIDADLIAAVERMLQTRNIDEITLVDLISEANVKPNVFYRRYESVENVIKEFLIADDHRMLVEGLQAAIEGSGIAKVIDTSHTFDSCRKTLLFRRPDVLLLDISMPDGSGIDFCKEMHEAYPDMKILMLTSYDEYTMVSRAVAAGASGYIQKNALAERSEERRVGKECRSRWSPYH